ncbi:MAG: HD domain-containing protein [Candidatus Promineifilaceae bacterium]|nr:HD domain-containing protein [Candidatus Promineifilaceae bacterium]
MEASSILELLLQGNQLKNTMRTGWVQRGVVDAENVAAHSFGVVFAVLMLAPFVREKINLERALIMAILHDLPESISTDIPTPSWRHFPEGIKEKVEYSIMNSILSSIKNEVDYMSIWEDFSQGQSPEALLVHDADKLDMYLQAKVYEDQRGNRQLAEFWTNTYQFSFVESQEVFDQLLSLRKK